MEAERGNIRGLTLMLPLSLYSRKKPAEDSANHTITVDKSKLLPMKIKQFWMRVKEVAHIIFVKNFFKRKAKKEQRCIASFWNET